MKGRIVSINPDDEKFGVDVRYEYAENSQSDVFINIGQLAEHCKYDKILEGHIINYDNTLVVSSLFRLLFLYIHVC